jgi:hypothetical protein
MSTSLASKMKRLNVQLQPIEDKIKALELQLENKKKEIEEQEEFLKEAKSKEKAYILDKDEAQAYIEELIVFHDFKIKGEHTSDALKAYIDKQMQKEEEEYKNTESPNAEIYSACRTACMELNLKTRYIDKHSSRMKESENEISTLKTDQEKLAEDIKKLSKEKDTVKRNAFLELYKIDVGKLSLSESILDPEIKKDIREIINIYQDPDAAKENGVYVPE